MLTHAASWKNRPRKRCPGGCVRRVASEQNVKNSRDPVLSQDAQASGTSYTHRAVDFGVVDSSSEMRLVGAVSRAELERCFERRWQAELLLQAGGGGSPATPTARRSGAGHAARARQASLQGSTAPFGDPLQPVLVAAASPTTAGGLGYRAPSLRQLPSSSSPSLTADTTFSGAQPIAVVEMGSQPQACGSSPPALGMPGSHVPAIELAPWRPTTGQDTPSPRCESDADHLASAPAWEGQVGGYRRAEDWERLVSPSSGTGDLQHSSAVAGLNTRTLLHRGATWLHSILVRGPGAVSTYEFDPAWLSARIVWEGLPADPSVSLPSNTSEHGDVVLPPQPVRLDPAPFQVAAATPLPKVGRCAGVSGAFFLLIRPFHCH